MTAVRTTIDMPPQPSPAATPTILILSFGMLNCVSRDIAASFLGATQDGVTFFLSLHSFTWRLSIICNDLYRTVWRAIGTGNDVDRSRHLRLGRRGIPASGRQLRSTHDMLPTFFWWHRRGSNNYWGVHMSRWGTLSNAQVVCIPKQKCRSCSC